MIYPADLAALFNRLSPQIGAWATQQFDHGDARLGVLEELGEASHCLLKRIQRIRGFDKDDHFKAKLADAMADALVFMSNVTWKCSIELAEDPLDPRALAAVITIQSCHGPKALLGNAFEAASKLLQHDDQYFCWVDERPAMSSMERSRIDYLCHSVLAAIAQFAAYYEINACDALTITWREVSHRDWRADSMNAASKAAEASLETPETLPAFVIGDLDEAEAYAASRKPVEAQPAHLAALRGGRGG